MNQTPAILVSPVQVIKNTCLHIKIFSKETASSEYRIADEHGRVVRKGSVSDRISEFSLSMVGIRTGVYRFMMGAAQQQFVVVL